MQVPKTVSAFSAEEYQKVHRLLASKVALMMGRKFEEDDWAEIYCSAKNIPHRGWSNLNIDVMYNGLGVEHKMLKAKNITLKTLCGTRPMHPALTRSIRIPATNDADEAMHDILSQYADLLEQRKQKLRELYPDFTLDMRTGWLLWQESLEEFMYFEEEMLSPNPNDYRAEWSEKASRGARKQSRNLWIFEKETGYKRYSVTTEAGAKIQPYFDIPPPNDPNLYLFRVQGEILESGFVRLWLSTSSYRDLQRLLGTTSSDLVSARILEISKQEQKTELDADGNLAQAILISQEAYTHLKETFEGVSDEHLIQLFIEQLR
jgi:hypothetical protein